MSSKKVAFFKSSLPIIVIYDPELLILLRSKLSYTQKSLLYLGYHAFKMFRVQGDHVHDPCTSNHDGDKLTMDSFSRGKCTPNSS